MKTNAVDHQAPACVCGGSSHPVREDGARIGTCPRFRCSWCYRATPWCRGASDNHPGRCDECWTDDNEAPVTPACEAKS